MRKLSILDCSKDGSDSFFILLDDLKRKLIAGHNLVFLETENVGFVANVASVLNGLITDKSDPSL